LTFAFEQFFQISLECGFCCNHRIERFLHLGGFVVIIDPVGTLPIFVALTHRQGRDRRRHTAMTSQVSSLA
jgi:hypothetical protein